MNRDVFISYSRLNYDTVMEIKRQIDAATGTECWIDLKGIESGSEQFTDDIIEGINNCKVFLFMLTKQSQESKWALRELTFAEKKKKHVVLVNIDDAEMNDRFSFKYSLTDTIAWNNQLQRDKLFRDLYRWINTTSEPITSVTQSATPLPLQELEKRLVKLDKEVGDLVKFSDSSGKWGFVDKTGKLVIPCQWEYVGNVFIEGLARVKDSSGKWGFIDKTGKLVIPCLWDEVWSFIAGMARVKDSSGKWGLIDKTGRIISPCKWEVIWIFRDSMSEVQDSNGKWGLIDKSGKMISPCKWNYVCTFSEGLAAVQDSNGKWGYIDKTGELVIPCEWDDVESFKNGVAEVQVSKGILGLKKRVRIDKTGKVIS